MILARRIHQLLKAIATIFATCLGRVIRGGNLVFAAPNLVAPLALVGVFSTLFPHADRVADVMWGLPLVVDFSHCIFSVSELGHDVEEVGCGFWPSAAELMIQSLIGGVVGECTNHIGIGGVVEFISLLGEPLDVISEAFLILLDVSFEVLRAPRLFVGALEITHEDLLEVDPIVDGAARQVFEPGPRTLREMDGEELDD